MMIHSDISIHYSHVINLLNSIRLVETNYFGTIAI